MLNVSYKYTLCNTHGCLVALQAVLSHKSVIYIKMIVLFLNYLLWLNSIVIIYTVSKNYYYLSWKVGNKIPEKILNGKFCGQGSCVLKPHKIMTVFIPFLQLGWCDFLSVESRILCVELLSIFEGFHIKGLSMKIHK